MQNHLLSPVSWDFTEENKASLRVMFIGDAHLSHATPQSRQDNYPETMLGKIRQCAYAANHLKVDLVILSGDVFHTKQQPDRFLIRCIEAFTEFDCPVVSIIGNHDIYYTKVESIEKAPLGVLFSSEKVRRLGNVTYKVNGQIVTFTGMDYCLNPVLPECPQGNYNVLVGHNFMPAAFSQYAPEECLNAEDIQSSKFDCLMLGHDHAVYPPDKQYGKLILRPGALSRGTKHVANRVRDVCINVLDINSIDDVQAHSVALKVLPAQQIFSEAKIEREEISKEMSSFVKSLRTKSTSEVSEIETILQELCSGEDPAVFHYSRQYLVNNSIL